MAGNIQVGGPFAMGGTFEFAPAEPLPFTTEWQVDYPSSDTLVFLPIDWEQPPVAVSKVYTTSNVIFTRPNETILTLNGQKYLVSR